jgi:ribosomal protein S18 acetylase RimI-like enzyme
MSEAVELRQATPADQDAIADVYLASRADALPYLRRIHTDDQVRAWIGRVVVNRPGTWVALADGGVVGFLSVEGEDLDQLYLAPGFYRRGIGSRLLEKAKALSPTGLHLYAFQRNTRARAFYEAHGFTVFDVNDGSRNEEGEPDVRYEWRDVLSRHEGRAGTPKA